MANSIRIRHTYKYRLYRNNKRDKYLHRMINVAGNIWNHCIALQRRFYSRFKAYIPKAKLKEHIAYLRMKTKRFSFWKFLNAQSTQDVIDRIDFGYQKFFKKKAKRPKFRRINKYRSITFTQSCWKLLENNKIEIAGKVFKYVKSREINGVIKTVTIKRDSLNRLWIFFSVIEEMKLEVEASTGGIGGFDFGLTTFLTDDTGKAWMHPLFFHSALSRIKLLSRQLSRKKISSNNYHRAKQRLLRLYIHLTDKRRDFHFKLARALASQYKVLVFEDLNIRGMRKRWGRKIDDLGFKDFLKILEFIVLKYDSSVVYINRFLPTSQLCSDCGNKQSIPLKQRIFICEKCGLSINRDHNAARNIKSAGSSALG